MQHNAEVIMETVSMVTRTIRREMKKHRPVEMSMQQFRVLRILERHPDISLSAVAEHMGLTNASASKLVESLVKQELMTRKDSPEDRRRVVLSLTKTGKNALEEARSAALGRLAEILGDLDAEDRSAVIRAMEVLRTALTDVTI